MSKKWAEQSSQVSNVLVLRCCVACLCEQQSSFAELTKADITKFIRTNPCLKHLNYHLLGITLWAGS